MWDIRTSKQLRTLNFSMQKFVSRDAANNTVWGGNFQLQGPHPREKCNYTQQLYQDVRNAWQTTQASRNPSPRKHISVMQLPSKLFSCQSCKDRLIPFSLIDCRYMNNKIIPLKFLPLIDDTIIMEKHHNKTT